jgi:hypothetical protein
LTQIWVCASLFCSFLEGLLLRFKLPFSPLEQLRKSLAMWGAASMSPLHRTIQSLSVGCSVAMALAMLPAAYQGTLFAAHPLMFTLGFLMFMTEGIMVS